MVAADIVGSAIDTAVRGCNSTEGNFVGVAEEEVIEEVVEKAPTPDGEDMTVAETVDWDAFEFVSGKGYVDADSNAEVEIEIVEQAEMETPALGNDGNWCTWG